MARTTTSKNGTARKPVSIESSHATGAATPPVETPRPRAVAESKPAGSAAAGAWGTGAKPTHEQIGRRAYEIYLERCQLGQPGTAHGDWARAELELSRG